MMLVYHECSKEFPLNTCKQIFYSNQFIKLINKTSKNYPLKFIPMLKHETMKNM